MGYTKLNGNEPIQIIQGDTYTYQIKFKDDTIIDYIDHIVLTSKSFGIEEDMLRVTDNSDNSVLFIYRFDTSGYMAKNTTYDITIHFVNGDILSQTGNPLIIVEKKNKES